MNRFECTVLGFFLGMLFLTILLWVADLLPYDRYIQGQIAALSGHKTIELVTLPDSTRIWKEIPR